MTKAELVKLLVSMPDDAEVVTLADDVATIRPIEHIRLYGEAGEKFIVIGNDRS